jgi:MFS family permease
MSSAASKQVVMAAPLAANGRERLLVAVLLSAAPCMALMFVLVAPVLSGLAAYFGHGTRGALIAQMIMTLPGIGVILGGPITGWLVERAGTRRTLFASLIAYTLAGLGGLVINGLWLMLAARLVLGCSAAGIATSTMALIGQRYQGDVRARILGYQNAVGAGVALPALLAAGAIGEVAGWRAPFALYLFGGLVLLLAVWCVPETPPISRERQPSASSVFHLWPVYLLIVLVFAAVFMSAVQLAFLLVADGVTSPALQSWVLAASSVATMIGAGFYGRVRVRLGSYGTFALCLSLLAVGFGTIGVSHSAGPTAVGSAVSGLGGGAVGPYLAGVLLERAPEAVRGRAVGFMYTAIYLGDFANPLLVTPLRSLLGIHGAFITVSVVLAVSAAYVALRPSFSRA